MMGLSIHSKKAGSERFGIEIDLEFSIPISIEKRDAYAKLLFPTQRGVVLTLGRRS